MLVTIKDGHAAMVQKLKSIFGRVDLRVLAVLTLGVLACTLILAVAQNKDEAPYDQAEYDALVASQFPDLYDLEQWFAEQQNNFLPILPPFADFILESQPGQPVLLPFKAEKFPKEFINGLVGTYEYSVPVYPVKIAEDPKTRALKFYNLDGKEFFTLNASADYDPFAYLKSRMPGLYAAQANPANRAYWESLFDPARIQISARLITPENVEHWLYAKAKVEAALQSEEGGGMMMRVSSEDSTTNIHFTQIKKATNGVRAF